MRHQKSVVSLVLAFGIIAVLAMFPLHLASAATAPCPGWSEPAPRVRGPHVANTGQWWYVAVCGQVAVVDLGDPYQPRLVGHLSPTLRVESVTTDGRVLAAAGSSGVVLYDLADPGQPAERATYAGADLAPESWVGPSKVDDLIATEDSMTWLQTSTPWSPDNDDPTNRMLYIQAVDTHDPARPARAFLGFEYRDWLRVGRLGAAPSGRWLVLREVGIGIGTFSEDLLVYDAARLDAVRLITTVASVPYSQAFTGTQVHDDLLYTARWQQDKPAPGPLEIFRLSGDSPVEPLPAQPGIYPFVAIAGRRAWSSPAASPWSAGSETMILNDLAVPEHPVARATLHLPGPALDFGAADHVAVAVEWEGWRRLFVVDGLDMDRPRVIAELPLLERGEGWGRLFLPWAGPGMR